MKNTKHTPGPWIAKQRENSFLCHVSTVDKDNFQSIGDFGDIANANLIAAAPEMLEALEKFAHDLMALKHSTDEADYPLEIAEYITNYVEPILTELIAKAKGGAK